MYKISLPCIVISFVAVGLFFFKIAHFLLSMRDSGLNLNVVVGESTGILLKIMSSTRKHTHKQYICIFCVIK